MGYRHGVRICHAAKVGSLEFHVSAKARRYYQFDLSLFSSSGNVIFADFEAARRFAAAMNAKRDLANHPESAVSAAQIAAMGLIDEMLHFVVEQYRRQHNPHVMLEALGALEATLGADTLETALRAFAQEFPPIRVYRGELALDEYLSGHTEGRANREILLEEMLMLWLANANPAFAPFLELFDDAALEHSTAYLSIIQGLEAFFEAQPASSESGVSLFRTLRLPALMHPDSLEAQLEFLLKRFGGTLGRFAQRILTGIGVLKEAARSFWTPVHFDTPPGHGITAEMYNWRSRDAEYEPEAFSPDVDWMPRVVLLAKNTFVWLDQLSKKYARPITTLDQIPEEELDILASWGITALWLIGLWERSPASRRIKQMMGNPDAVASAYSLYDYVIAKELGGEAALEVLRQRAWRRGIRLASDMVPNHTGIDSKWVIEHPDRFISLPYPPYPTYTFNGPDLSSDPRVGIFLEDHYYDKSDAAVVFKRVDRRTGEVRYIYHGNDGTAMPWNDTAQLNYLNPEVREAVIQTILHVARQFPIIRFDAAMTLTKRHIQRLWWPEPGGSPWGASIPSRAEHAMPKEEFDRLVPQEFWREVVDRCAAEAPDTLLLAEAFWMMEGYFVRTLGMHRVYNSAFMNMLRDEKNGEYRAIMKNTLEFEPEILKRFVNFLNNPDEKTAAEQFGKGDKYFGVMTLCATLPGLPMVGHGQVEGFSERYGMEYRRAYYDETPDQGFIRYHHQQIFPLFKRRHLFAEVEHFVLYDFSSEEGVNEDVFAYSNRHQSERALIVYHNKNTYTKGWVHTSVAQAVKTGEGREMLKRTLGQGLGLGTDSWAIFRDAVSGLEYLRPSRELHERGLYLELGPYQRHVFLDWREVSDPEGIYARLAHMLGGAGAASVERLRQELWLEPVLTPFRQLVNPQLFEKLIGARVSKGKPDKAVLDEGSNKLSALVEAAREFGGRPLNPDLKALRKQLEALLRLPAFVEGLEPARATPSKSTTARLSRKPKRAPRSSLPASLDDRVERWGVLLGWLFVQPLADDPQTRIRLLDEWLLGRVLADTLREMGLGEGEAERAVGLVRVLLAAQPWLAEEAPKPQKAKKQLKAWLQDPLIQRHVQTHRFEGAVYFNQEAFEAMLSAMVRLVAVVSAGEPGRKVADTRRIVREWYAVLERYRSAALKAGYRLDKLLEPAPTRRKKQAAAQP
ncbi:MULTISPECIES: alpha-amylase family glycosyl hydrolase [unclassified Meiothermus]|uniref:alpha-amylase family glycosyl hydrolase n=1 Tax=unclassified Meiothermus TaxID=370471 RepID=UPI000D7BE1C0|nr:MULTISPECIES: alpha-amylase family glycosyl hydrolase [unclassified Meiothermus]PZA07018.1 alpha-amylase [Meiothermus sp. Pnk-1]RYM35280.1 alpha-amylase [Meiothermus sp. PNK-Is4]